MTASISSPVTLATRWRQYMALTKPRVVLLIVFCAVIGMLLAEPGWPRLALALPAMTHHARAADRSRSQVDEVPVGGHAVHRGGVLAHR